MHMMTRHAAILAPLGERVRALRTSQGLTLGALAARALLSPRFVASLEAGSGNISVARLADVAAALGTTPAALLTGLGAPARPGPRVIALLGLRGAGKTTLGKRLARKLKLPFFELDQLIERQAGLALSEIFDVHGEAYFRKVERDVLERFLDQRTHEGPGAVLATGGGLVTDRASYRLLKARATTVWLKARPEDHWNRVVAQGDRRPMGENPHAMAELRGLLSARSPLYAEAQVTVDTSALGVEGTLRALAAASA